MWSRIFDEVAREDDIYRAVLRLVCRRWKRMATKPAKDIRHDRLLLCAAHDGHIELCKLARSWMMSDYDELQQRVGAGPPPWDFVLDVMAAIGTQRDRFDIIDLARSWGATDKRMVMQEAAFHNSERSCAYVKEWGASKKDFDTMLYAGARKGHERICELAVEWGANNFVDALNAIEIAGNEEKMMPVIKRLMDKHKWKTLGPRARMSLYKALGWDEDGDDDWSSS
jgi:hypothetical protein